MARNVERKVMLDADELLAVEGRLVDAGHTLVTLHQVDTYLRPARGRLKVRQIHTDAADTLELIAYSRLDEIGTRLSDYQVVAVDPRQATALLAGLRATLGELVVVEKERRVAVTRRTRVHLDRVVGLGCFVELETVLADGDDPTEGKRELAAIVSMLGLGAAPPIAGSYSDLLLGKDPDASRTTG